MSLKKLLMLTLVLSISANVFAAEQTTTLNVTGMTCASCSYQVKRALSNVDGVREATVGADTHEALIVYDDAQTNVEELTAAATNAGFPSTVKEIN